MHLLVLRGNELLFLRLLVPELSHHGMDLDSLLVRLLYLPHLGRCVAYSAMVNAPNPDGASTSTVPHVTTPALLVLTVVLMMGVLADAFRPSILLRAAITVLLVQCRMTDLRLALHLLFAVAMARNSAGPSMSIVLNAIASRPSWLPTASFLFSEDNTS